MTTTDHSPTMEQRLKQRLNKVAETYHRFLDRHSELQPQYNLYEMPFTKGATNNLVALVTADKVIDLKIDGIAAIEYMELSKNNRVKLSRSYEGYRKFIPVLYPGDVIESVTLYIAVLTPKDPLLKQKWADGDDCTEITDDEPWWGYCPEKCDIEYVPVYRVDNVTGPFDFGRIIWCPTYYRLSIEVKYSQTQIDAYMHSSYPHTFGLDGVTLNCQARRDLHLIEDYVLNKNEQGELRLGPTERDRVLEEMKNCPVCKSGACRICNCEHRDSVCEAGHQWYYEPETNKIVQGEWQH